MAKYRNGPLGPLSGRLGDKVYSSWKNVDVVKDAPKKSTKEPTQMQLDQREKFGLMMAFFSCIYDLIFIGFKTYSKKMTQMNAAVMFNKGIITGTSPNFSIDYPKVRISEGRLKNPVGLGLKCDAQGQMMINWDFYPKYEEATDRACILFYDETSNECFALSEIVRREDAKLSFFKQPEAKEDVVHVWLFFMSANEKSVSNSIYLGKG